MNVQVRVTSTPYGIIVDIGCNGIHLSRVEAHRVAIALLIGCVPQATESSIALEIHGQGPDPEASTWQDVQWR